MQGGAGQMIPVRVFGQAVYIGTVNRSFIVQAESVGNHYLARPDGPGDFQFYFHSAGRGCNSHQLSVFKTLLFSVLGIH